MWDNLEQGVLFVIYRRFHYSEVILLYTLNNISGPSKAVCYRDVSVIRGVCCERCCCNSSIFIEDLFSLDLVDTSFDCYVVQHT